MTRRRMEEQSEAALTSPTAFDRYRKLLGVVLTPIAFAAVWLLVAGRLSPQGQSLAAILAAVGVLWATEPLPLPVTAILGAVLCILLGVADAKTVLAPFADPIIFLFIGSFILARAMTLHGLDRRIALGFLSLRWIGGHPVRVFGGLGLITALLSMWVSNTATTALMLPVALGILHALQPPDRGDATNPRHAAYASGMMLMIAYAASIGGIGTPVGSPPNLIALGLIRSLAGVEISFFRWMALAVPMVLVMGLALFVMLRLLHPPELSSGHDAESLQDYLRQERRALGPWSIGQINTAIAFALAVILWLSPGVLSLALGGDHPWTAWLGVRVPEAVVALAVAILLFVLPLKLREGQFTMTWEEAAKIDWGTILLFGGGLSLGTLMFRTGVAEAMAQGVTALTGTGSLWTLTAVSIAVGILLSETTSNTASATMLVPVVIAIAQAGGVNPVPPALGACFGASYGFMLPVSTPPNAIVYGSGLVPIRQMIRAGLLFDLLGLLLILAALRLLCPLLGLSE